MRRVEYTVIGGGVAGLSAANRLQDLGKQPLVIEAGTYPKDTVCGEFLSPECLPILKSWKISPSRLIDSVKFISGNKVTQLSLPNEAGSLARSLLEKQLLDRLENSEVMTDTKVKEIIPSESGHKIVLESGKEIQTDQLIISAGRFYGNSIPKICYYGAKAHIDGIHMENLLEMHLFDGAYAGISPVSDDCVNVAILSKKKLNLPKSVNWTTTAVPEFTNRELPNWPNCYFIGDAALSIPPITGDGLSIAISSGYHAAEAALEADANGFRRLCRREYSTRRIVGRLLNRAAMQPLITKPILSIGSGLLKQLYRITR